MFKMFMVIVTVVVFLLTASFVVAATPVDNAEKHSICELMTGEDLFYDTQAFLKDKPLYISRIMPVNQCSSDVWGEYEAEIKSAGGQYSLEREVDENGNAVIITWRRW